MGSLRSDRMGEAISSKPGVMPHRILLSKCVTFGCDRPVSDLRWALGHYTCGRHEHRRESDRSTTVASLRAA